MKYRVNDGCIGYGLCEESCPEVFSMIDEGVAKADEAEVPRELKGAAEEAKDGCPVGAIEEV